LGGQNDFGEMICPQYFNNNSCANLLFVGNKVMLVLNLNLISNILPHMIYCKNVVNVALLLFFVEPKLL